MYLITLFEFTRSMLLACTVIDVLKNPYLTLQYYSFARDFPAACPACRMALMLHPMNEVNITKFAQSIVGMCIRKYVDYQIDTISTIIFSLRKCL